MTDNKAFSRNDFLKLAGAASLSLLGLTLSERLKISPPTAPNIVVLVFDALSALDMSLYGFPRQTTPNFERFAQRATVYHQHYSPANFTTPGTASLLTGVLPWTHRAFHLQGEVLNTYANQNIFSLLPAGYHRFSYTHNSLVQILLEQFKGNIDQLLKISDLTTYSNFLVDKLPLNEFHIPLEAEMQTLTEWNHSSLFLSLVRDIQVADKISQLSESYHSEFPRGLPGCRPDKASSYCFTIETAREWLVQKIKQTPAPFFGYVHLFPPHSPYNPSRQFIGAFEDKITFPKKPAHHFTLNETYASLNRLRRMYDETIAYVDDEFGKLVDALEQADVLENLCLVVTSDHGEINERGINYHNTPVLYEPLMHIPLLISYPGQKERRDIHQQTQSIDVLPTLLQLTDAKIPPDIEGVPLPKTDQPATPDRDLFFIEAKSCQKLGRLTPATFAVLHGRYKLIYYHGYKGFNGVYELYDLQEDPEEIRDLSNSQSALLKDLQEILSSKIGTYV